jgi:hypothetical protein
VILPLPYGCTFSLMIFIINDQEHFQINSTVHRANKYFLYRLIASLWCFKRVHSVMASKFSTIYHLVSKVLWMRKHNLNRLKTYLNTHSFYSVDELLLSKNDLIFYSKVYINSVSGKVCEIPVYFIFLFFIFLCVFQLFCT